MQLIGSKSLTEALLYVLTGFEQFLMHQTTERCTTC